jgi:spore coat protein CotF
MLAGITGLAQIDLATDMLKDTKFTVITLAKAVTEVENPELKQVLADHLMTAIQQHHKLADLVVDKNWLQPFLEPADQVATDMQMTGKLT